MTRSKVKLQLFAKESQRRVSYRKRKRGMMKKLDELTTLCGVDACAIVSSPYDANIEVWPSHAGVQRVLTRFRNMPEVDQTKKMFDQETFIRERIQKVREQLRKLSMENKRNEIDIIINKCLVGDYSQCQNNLAFLHDMDLVLHQNVQEIKMRIQSHTRENVHQEIPIGGLQTEGSSK